MPTKPKPSTQIPKYRPYLSLAEMNAILNAIDGDFSTGNKVALMGAKRAIHKMKLAAEAELVNASYTTNPRPPLLDRLGFEVTGQVDIPVRIKEDVPDFGTMMSQIEEINPTNSNDEEKPE
jgi:hypothetical protein